MSEVSIYDATDLSQVEWRQLQGISREAFTSALDRTQAEIDTLIAWENPAVFYASHINPNAEVGKRYAANQSYSKPRVAVVTTAGEPVGFAFSAHNVSGATEQERLLKKLSVVKNYLWIREVSIRPAFRGQGVAKELGKALLKDATPLQPPTAYIWPDEVPFLQGKLERVGFVATGEQAVEVFGETSLPIRQVRMQGSSAWHVLRQL